MNLPTVISSLIQAQNSHNSQAYIKCFSELAVVHDEGKTHKGKADIQRWIERSNREYHTELKPLNYKETAEENLLTAEVYGEFPGSPAILQFHFSLENGLVKSLRITG